MVEHRPCNPVVMGSIPIAGSITKQQVRRVKSSGLLPFWGPRAPRRAPHRAPHFRYLGFGVALGRWSGLSAPVSSISANFANLGESAQVSEFSENGISGRTDDAREIRVSENSQGRAGFPKTVFQDEPTMPAKYESRKTRKVARVFRDRAGWRRGPHAARPLPRSGHDWRWALGFRGRWGGGGARGLPRVCARAVPLLRMMRRCLICARCVLRTKKLNVFPQTVKPPPFCAVLCKTGFCGCRGAACQRRAPGGWGWGARGTCVRRATRCGHGPMRCARGLPCLCLGGGVFQVCEAGRTPWRGARGLCVGRAPLALIRLGGGVPCGATCSLGLGGESRPPAQPSA